MSILLETLRSDGALNLECPLSLEYAREENRHDN